MNQPDYLIISTRAETRAALLYKLRRVLRKIEGEKRRHEAPALLPPPCPAPYLPFVLEQLGKPGGVPLESFTPYERLRIAEDLLRYCAAYGLSLPSDAAVEIEKRYFAMKRRQSKPGKEPNKDQRKATAVYAARFLEYEGIDVYRKAVNLLYDKIGIVGAAKKEVEALQDWFERHERAGTLPRIDEELFDSLTKEYLLRS